VGDVGRSVLSDRQALGQEGMIVLVLPRHKGEFQLEHLEIVSRGFVFMKEAHEVIDFIHQAVKEILGDPAVAGNDDELKKSLERRLARRLYKIIRREPMILPVIIEV
jgi:ribonuclease J